MQPRLPVDYMFDLLDDEDLVQHYQVPREHSWLAAAKDMQIPVFVPGFEDSTLGNIYAARVIDGSVANHSAIASGTVHMEKLARWYQEQTASSAVGFFQIGGGIAGDFPICVVPMLIQDLKLDVPFWSYFCQISDAVTSYGGYSGARSKRKNHLVQTRRISTQVHDSKRCVHRCTVGIRLRAGLVRPAGPSHQPGASPTNDVPNQA